MRIRPMHVAAAAVGSVIAAGAGVAIAQESPRETSDPFQQQSQNERETARATRADLERAAQSALRAVNGERLESVDRERGGYEVEVRQADGAEVEVFVDRSFDVVSREREDDRDEDDRDDDDRGEDDWGEDGRGEDERDDD